MIAELRKKYDEKVKAAKAIAAPAAAEKRSLTPEDEEKVKGLMAEADSIRSEIDTLTALEAHERHLQAPANGRIAPGEMRGLDVPAKDLRNYSLLRALNLRADGKELDGLEGEISKEVAKRSGKNPQGFYMPTAAMIEQRDLTTTTGTGGVNTGVLFQDFITLLRNKLVIQSLGARFMGGLVGNFSIPRQNQGGSAYWVTEGNPPAGSNQTIDSVALTPKTVGANTILSRKFIKQTSLDAEAFVRNDLAQVLAQELDRVAINGSGVGAEPEGILNMAGVREVASEGGLLNYDKVVALETAVAMVNADMGALAYLTSPKVRGKLKTTEKATSTAHFLWDKDELNGYRAVATNTVPDNLGSPDASAILFGNWNDLIIAMWGGLDITVDPYKFATSGGVQVSMLQDVDVKVRHALSFSRCDAITVL